MHRVHYVSIFLEILKKEDNMHLVTITSVICPQNAATVFSTEERFQQLIGSIRSVHSNIPNCLVVVIEGSAYTDEQVNTVMQSGAHTIAYINVDAYDKQSGESSLLYQFFKSDIFADLRERHNVLSISKLSGRYVLTEDFVFHYDAEMCICKIIQPENSYSGHGALLTRFYSLPIAYLDQYVEGLGKCCHEGIFINIEHTFYRYQVIPLDKIHRQKQVIHVGGRIAPTGEYVED